MKHKLLAILAVGLLAGPLAAGAATLTYTGNNFTRINNFGGPSIPPVPYTTADKITGSLEIAAPLASNLTEAVITPTSFTFTDGVNTYTNGNAGSDFRFWTNGSGEIIFWHVNLQKYNPEVGGGTFQRLDAQKVDIFIPVDLAQDVFCAPDSTAQDCSFHAGFYSQQADNADVPGVWTTDDDADGVANADDQCPNTVIPESAPTLGTLGKGRYALKSGFTFSMGPKTRTTYTTTDTAGCSCEQIVAALGLGVGQLKYGCSKSAMDAWIIGLP